MAMRLPRIWSSSFSGSPRMLRPRKRTSPVMVARFLGSRPRMAIDVTVLPEPDSPTMPSVSPSRSV